MEVKVSISVIMLTYNRERMLSHMIESILDQTFDDFEFIIVDNGSTDCSGRIAEEYASRYSQIRVVHIKKGSIGKGRNVGLSVASGKYVAFVDDDDTCEVTYLERLYTPLNGAENEVSICGTNRSCGNCSINFSGKEALEALLDRKYFNVGFPTKLIPRELFNIGQFREDVRFDDIYLMPIIIANAKRVHYIAEPLYQVKRHEGNNSAWTTDYHLLTENILQEYMEVYGKRTVWLCKKYPEDSLLWKYYKWSFYISMVQKIHKYQLEKCYVVCRRMEANLRQNRNEFLTSPKIQPFEKEWMEEYVE